MPWGDGPEYSNHLYHPIPQLPHHFAATQIAPDEQVKPWRFSHSLSSSLRLLAKLSKSADVSKRSWLAWSSVLRKAGVFLDRSSKFLD